MTVRAGGYAEFEGVTYPCVSVRKPRVRLIVPADEEQPEGFERHPDGRHWTRLVDRSEVSRLFHVVTEAVWAGRPVKVETIEGDRVWVWSRSLPRPDRPEVIRDQDSWSARVPVSELQDVVSVTTEVPL